jgi:hypothetical protein
MPETFPDGFPMTPAEAIEFSYFFSESEKQDWREWLTTASSQEQAELVDMLHKIWLDKQKQAVPNQFANNQNPQQVQASPESNFNQNPTNQVNNFNPQPDFYENQEPKPVEPIPQSEFKFEDLSDPNPEQTVSEISNNVSNNNSISDGNGNPKTTNEVSFANNSVLNNTAIPDFDDDFNFNFDDIADEDDTTEEKPEPVQETNDLDEDEDDTKTEPEKENLNEVADFYDDKDELYPVSEIKQIESNSEPKTTPSFSISKVREGTTAKELQDLYQSYLNSRSSVTLAKQDHDQNYDDLMQKVVSIVLNFETVADYLEFMVGKLSEMNETIIKQAEEIASFKNGQNNHAHDLQQDLNQILSRVDVIEKNQTQDFEQFRSRLDNIEIKNTGQNNSAYSEYDNLNTQIDLMKSKIIKLEKELAKDQNNDFSGLNGIPVPKTSYQNHPPLSQKLKEFTENSIEKSQKLVE